MNNERESTFDPLADAETKKNRKSRIYLVIIAVIILGYAPAVWLYQKYEDYKFTQEYARTDASLDSLLGSEWDSAVIYVSDDTEIELEADDIAALRDMLSDITITSKKPRADAPPTLGVKYIEMTVNGRWVSFSNTNSVRVDQKANYKMYNCNGRFYDQLTEFIEQLQPEAAYAG